MLIVISLVFGVSDYQEQRIYRYERSECTLLARSFEIWGIRQKSC